MKSSFIFVTLSIVSLVIGISIGHIILPQTTTLTTYSTIRSIETKTITEIKTSTEVRTETLIIISTHIGLSENEYRSWFEKHYSELSEIFHEVAMLFEKESPETILRMLSFYREKVNKLHYEASKIEPPERYREVHYKYLKVMEYYSDGLLLFVEGVERGLPSLVSKATSYIEKAKIELEHVLSSL